MEEFYDSKRKIACTKMFIKNCRSMDFTDFEQTIVYNVRVSESKMSEVIECLCVDANECDGST